MVRRINKVDELKNKGRIRFKDGYEEMFEAEASETDFPTYTTQIINIANQNSQATRANVVGQMSDLVIECPYKTQKEWEEWYLESHPDAIEKATKKAYEGVKNLKEAIGLIDEDMVRKWITDLVLVKSRRGIIYQKIILKYLANERNTTCRLATPEEESQGIDGFIGDTPVQIKPETYIEKGNINFESDVDIIYYRPADKSIAIFYDDIF